MNHNNYCPKKMYVDESGSMGARGSKFLILTAVCVLNSKKISKIFKSAKIELQRTNSGMNWLAENKGEVKFAKFPNKNLRKEIIKKLSQLDLEVTCLVIDKNHCQMFYEEKRDILFMMLENHVQKKHKFPVKAILDNDFLSLNRGGYLFLREYEKVEKSGLRKDSFCQLIFSENIDGNEKHIRVDEKDSKQNYCLQLADFISGAIFREYEFGDKTFTNIIRKYKKIYIKLKKVLQNPLYSSISSI